MLNSAVGAVSNFFGNPSSAHWYGLHAKTSLNEHRDQVAKALGVESNTIIFTSGGTEANNLALSSPEHTIITSAIEHSSVHGVSPWYYLDVLEDGSLDLSRAEKMLKQITSKAIVSVMLANNETGVILDPTNQLLEWKRKYGFTLHVDAVQGFGKMIDYQIPEEVDMLSISAHKIHGLKGSGALYVKNGTELQRLFKAGGSHEFGLRPGTENDIGIYSLGFMSEKITTDQWYRKRIEKISILRDELENYLSDISEVNGTSMRVGNTTNLWFPAVTDTGLFIECLSEAGVAASGGSACASGMPEPSRVLSAMFGKDSPRPLGSVRFSLSVNTTQQEILLAKSKIRAAHEAYKEMKDV
jgi:cysteine desulfurase